MFNKTLLVYTLLFTIFMPHLYYVAALNCDKVASLPNDFGTILPEYEKLHRIHTSNYFFLDAGQNDAYMTFKINIRQRSVVRIQATPLNSDLEMKVLVEGQSNNLSDDSSEHLPADFVFFDVKPGIIEVLFTPLPLIEENMDLRKQSGKTVECDSPYMHLQIYIEDYDKFKKRTDLINEEAHKLDEFYLDFEKLFTKLPVKTDLTTIKIPVSEFSYYKPYNLTVLGEFDLTVPMIERTLNSSDDDNMALKYSLKLEMYTDFFLGGGLTFLLIKASEVETSLLNLECVFSGTCLLSDRPNKNSLIIESILTPGDYKILIVDLQSFQTFIDLKRHIAAIPATARLKIKKFEKSENRFNCDGRRLPTNLDYLEKDYKNYFEYRGDVVMNLEELNDEVSFTIEEDSLLRVVTFFPEGNKIDFELYRQADGEIEKLLANRINFSQTIGKSITGSGGKLLATSKSWGESDGLFLPLSKGKYWLSFNYENSFFEQSERRKCETFYLRLGIMQTNYLKILNPSVYGQKCDINISDLDRVFKDFEQGHSSSEEYTNKESNIYKLHYDRFNINKPVYERTFEIKSTVTLNIELLSDFVSSYLVPVIIPITKNNDSPSSLKSVLHHKHGKVVFHENTLKLKLKKGKYKFMIFNGLSQFNTDDTHEKQGLSFYDYSLIPRCLSLQIKISSIRLNNKKTANWECNVVHFEEIPSTLNNLRDLGLTDRMKEKFSFFSSHLLVPKKSKTMKIRTNSQSYLLRLVGEYPTGSGSEEPELEITLLKERKILRSAKPIVIEGEFASDQVYINYLLKPNTEYEINFELSGEFEQWDYYQHCRLFKLEISMTTSGYETNRRKE